MWVGEIVKGKMSQTGALSKRIDILAISNDIQFDLIRFHNSK